MNNRNIQDISWDHLLYSNSVAIEEREMREEARQVWNTQHYQVQESINDESE